MMTLLIITCPHCGKEHAALEFYPVNANVYEAACPETGETIRVKMHIEYQRKRPGPSEVK